MKKTLFLLIALVASMSINAQTTKVMTVLDGTSELATYKVKPTVKVVFKDVPTPTTGTAKRKNGEGQTDVNWVQLWENGPKFAEYNIGATNNKATDYGYYFAWGGIVNKNNTGNNGRGILTGDNDTATYLWGSNWRMPTQAELNALRTQCNEVWTTVGGVTGCKYTGKVAPYNANSIFIPAAGYCSGGTVQSSGSLCFYWTTSPYDTVQAYRLYITSGDKFMGYSQRTYGGSVRPVLVETIK